MTGQEKTNRKKGKREDDDRNAAVLRIRDVYPESWIRIFSIPDPGSKRFPDPHPPKNNLSIFNPKICF
jgi:hypothetical protein